MPPAVDLRTGLLATGLLGAGLLGGLAGCSTPPPAPPTVHSLAQRPLPPLATDAGVQATPTQAMSAYQAFLDTLPQAAQRPEALRRLGDLDMVRADDRLSQDSHIQPEQALRAAIARYQQLLAEAPQNPQRDGVLYQLARAQDLSGDGPAALATLEQLVREHPNSRYRDEAHFRRGEMLFAARRYPLAERAYAAVLDGAANNPFRERSLYMRGWSLFKLGWLEEALPPFMQVLDGQLAGSTDALALEALPHLSRADRELVEDTLRVVSLALAGLRGADTLAALVDGGPRRDAAGLQVVPHSADPNRFGLQVSATSPLRQAYELRVIHSLAALYQRQERYQDAADTWTAFARRYPAHDQAPLLDAQVIALQQQHGFASLALRNQEAFVERYGPGSPYQNANPSAWAPQQPQVRTTLAAITREHHARAQRERQPAAYASAVGWYQRWLALYPQDADTPAQRFLLAELLFEDGRWEQALAQYETSAYQDPPHPEQANAGYAALLSHEKRLATASAEQRPAWQREEVASAQRFVQHFPGDTRCTMVLTHAADTLHTLGDGPQAMALARQLLAWQPPADAAQRRVAWLVLAHNSFDAQDFAQAEAAYAQVRSLTPARAKDQDSLQERQAAAIYKQGEAAQSGGDGRAAVAHWQRAITLAPLSAVAVAARLDTAAALMALKDWAAAAWALEDFRLRHPKHPAQADITAKLALTYTEQRRWALAATEYERLADSARDPQLARAARWQAAQMQAQAAEASPAARPAAVRAWERYLKLHPSPLEPAVEARDHLAQLARRSGDSRRALAWTREVFEADQAGGAGRTARTRALGAAAALVLAEPLFEEYRKIALVEPLARQLKLKKTKMEQVLRAYNVATEAGAPEVASAATFRMAELYQDFGRALLNSQRPKKLSALELEQYNVLLEEQAFPFEEQAADLHQANAQRTQAGLWDDWVQRSLAALRSLRPVRWGKTERSNTGGWDAIR